MMKKAALMLTLSMVFMLSACEKNNQVVTKPNNEINTPTESTESTDSEVPESNSSETVSEIPSAYTELIEKYATALNEKWNGGALMEEGLNFMMADCYGETPMENIGYALIDLDDDGIQELVIGTTEKNDDDFYGKLIFDLYTLDESGSYVQVFSSSERNRYYYAGDNKFANLGSSSASENVETTLKYEEQTLTDTGSITIPNDYVQMNLTPMSQWNR